MLRTKAVDIQADPCLLELLVIGGGGTEVAKEGDFLAALRAGDEEAFATLVERESARMRATARRLLGCDHEAEDVVQEAFLQAYRAIGDFHGEARISTWLHRIVVNAALMKLRSRRRKPEQLLDDPASQLEAGDWPAAGVARQRSTDELFESAECRAIVRRAIDRLPEAYRRVLIIRDIEGFDTEEAAAMLDSTPNAIKVRLHRARQALRAPLERDYARA